MTDEMPPNRDPNITAEIQYRLVERLAESEKRYRDILAALPEVVLLLDSEGSIRYVNDSWERLLGYDPSESPGSQVIDHVLKDDRRKWKDLVENAVQGDEPPADRLVRFQTSTGETLWMNVGLRRQDSGEYVCSLEDFTTRRRLEAELLKSQRLESIGRLAGGLAHDFNNFLTIILGNINIAQSKLSNVEGVGEELEVAAKACTHASGVTKQMLTFSKGGAPVTRAGSIVDLVKESAELTLRGAKAKAILQIDDHISSVRMDDGQMHQVFGNLLLNADQAMPDGGEIRISIHHGVLPAIGEASDERAAVVIEVADNGTGIPQDDIDRVFDPYFSTKDDGTGLGLTTAFWIVQRHEGLLELESTPGVGTTFRITLPVATGKKLGHEKIDQNENGDIIGARILIMDDHDLVRNVLRMMLETSGHEVEEVSDGERCIEVYQAAHELGEPFDMVILDLTIPGGHGGVWTIEQLRKLDPNVRAIVASGYGSDTAIADSRSYGFMGRIQKPFRIEELQALVKEVLDPDSRAD